jgi:hypothetical protein
MMRWYDLNGLRLTIEAEAPELIAAIEQHVAPFVTVVSGACDYSISVGQGCLDEPPDDDVEVISEGDMVPGVPSLLAVKGEKTWLLVPNRLSIVSERTRKTTEIRIADGEDRPLLASGCIYAIDAALAASGQYLVHGAALTLPGAEPRALLLCAPSGGGKTTAALALALGGFGLITDDAIVLQPQGYRENKVAMAWGLPRALKLHRRTAELLPIVKPLLEASWDRAGEQTLQTTTLSRVALTVPPVPVPIGVIAILRDRTKGRHCLAPIEKAKALKLVAEDNVRRSRLGVPSLDVERFVALGSLIAATPTFQLRVGAPLALLPDHVAAVVSDLAQTNTPAPFRGIEQGRKAT